MYAPLLEVDEEYQEHGIEVGVGAGDGQLVDGNYLRASSSTRSEVVFLSSSA